MPREIKTSFERKIETLIQEVVVIDGQINPYEEYPITQEAQAWESYKKWLERVRAVFHKTEAFELLPHDFFFVESLELPRRSTVMLDTPAIVRGKKNDFYRTFRTQLHEAITKQVEALRSVCERYKQAQRQVVIHVEKSGLVWRDDKEMYFHKFPSMKNKRAQLIKHLYENGGAVQTAVLIKKVRYSGAQQLAQEKRRLNTLMRKQLKIDVDLILGGSDRRGQGYTLNPALTFIVEQKSS
jgi:hypothetical protein